MTMPELAVATTQYVINAPYFWASMGWTIATAMFIGATLYNGDLHKYAKAMVSLVSYGFFIFLVTSSRLIGVGQNGGFTDPAKAHAGVFTIVFVSVAYFSGMLFGVLLSRAARRGCCKWLG